MDGPKYKLVHKIIYKSPIQRLELLRDVKSSQTRLSETIDCYFPLQKTLQVSQIVIEPLKQIVKPSVTVFPQQKTKSLQLSYESKSKFKCKQLKPDFQFWFVKFVRTLRFRELQISEPDLIQRPNRQINNKMKIKSESTEIKWLVEEKRQIFCEIYNENDQQGKEMKADNALQIYLDENKIQFQCWNNQTLAHKIFEQIAKIEYQNSQMEVQKLEPVTITIEKQIKTQKTQPKTENLLIINQNSIQLEQNLDVSLNQIEQLSISQTVEKSMDICKHQKQIESQLEMITNQHHYDIKQRQIEQMVETTKNNLIVTQNQKNRELVVAIDCSYYDLVALLLSFGNNEIKYENNSIERITQLKEQQCALSSDYFAEVISKFLDEQMKMGNPYAKCIEELIQLEFMLQDQLQYVLPQFEDQQFEIMDQLRKNTQIKVFDESCMMSTIENYINAIIKISGQKMTKYVTDYNKMQDSWDIADIEKSKPLKEIIKQEEDYQNKIYALRDCATLYKYYDEINQ
ncbi:Hypothetical_protein [Hexamita inflata]|uniref:Hypothetical_protein n=1 Tax=Hexamita inflata TaxID=28002 RepID=A0AA86NX94_9EUKA|nr:Hypothetical protein HINF_LOCUS15972 [Hexamita inflata]